MEVTKQVVGFWSLILVALSAIFAIEVIGIPELNPLPVFVMGSVHSLALILISATLFLEAYFGKGGIQTKKWSDMFLVTTSGLAFILALVVSGMISIPAILQPVTAIMYGLLVIGLIVAFKEK